MNSPDDIKGHFYYGGEFSGIGPETFTLCQLEGNQKCNRQLSSVILNLDVGRFKVASMAEPLEVTQGKRGCFGQKDVLRQ